MSAPHAELERILSGSHFDPHALLGRHRNGDKVTIRTLKPHALSVDVQIGELTFPMTPETPGIWVLFLSEKEIDTSTYFFDTRYESGNFHSYDPFAFPPTLGDMDLHLIGEGRHEQLWQVLGAHPRTMYHGQKPVLGTAFSVWAPNAHGVQVIGDFNYWDGSAHPMRSLGSTGVWELFIPDVIAGSTYKFNILGSQGTWLMKADPMASATEVPPANASVIFESEYVWRDNVWLDNRARQDPHIMAMTTYEVHLGSWRPGLDYLGMARELVEYVKAVGFTHVEFLPVAEHPYGPSWGYQVTSYYAPTSRFGTPDQFRYLIDTLHQEGIGVILDWVPAHFPKDSWALANFDGTHLYEHQDPRRGEHPDWGTLIFDFGRNEVRNFLVANALYWLEEFHIDGLRVDAVASMLYLDYSREEDQWLPNQLGGRENLDAVTFLQELNATVYKRVPGVFTIAEESTTWPGVTRPTDLGGLGFGFKWNMGWMHDSLGYVQQENPYRKFHHSEMTFSLMYSFSENFVLPFSHDEVVHGKGSLISRMPGDRWQQFANLRAYLAFMWAHPGKKLLFMGSEFAQSSEWSSERGLDWDLFLSREHQGVLNVVTDLNHLYANNRALWERDCDPRGFEWIDGEAVDTSIFSWIRWSDHDECVAFIANFSPEVRYDFPFALPRPGKWTEVLNTDSTHYGGSGVGNLGQVLAQPQQWSGKPAMARITVPPLAAVFFEFKG
ncbi:MAG: 1,4-alpha-glucan branching protein GlgB [Candidatus Nanopelagicales bacterium]